MFASEFSPPPAIAPFILREHHSIIVAIYAMLMLCIGPSAIRLAFSSKRSLGAKAGLNPTRNVDSIDRRMFLIQTTAVSTIGGVTTWNALQRSELLEATTPAAAAPTEDTNKAGKLPVITAHVTSSTSAQENSSAIETAIRTALALGGNVRIPAGVYEHSGFTIANGVAILGDGIGRTILINTHPTNTSVSIRGTGAGDYSSGTSLHAMTITTNVRRPAQLGIHILLARAVEISQVEVSNHGIGIQHKAAWSQYYRGVRVSNCQIGWHVPEPNPHTPSTPVTLVACHAVDCETGLQVDDGLESFTWLGGDFSRCSIGIKLDGNQTRQLNFYGINFEEIAGDAIEIGGTAEGPAGVTFAGCRFFSVTGRGQRAVNYATGTDLTFIGCRWTGYELAIRQSTMTGPLIFLGCSTYDVNEFLDLNGTIHPISPLLVTRQPSGAYGWPNSSGTAFLDFGDVPTESHIEHALPVTGAKLGEPISLGVPPSAASPGIVYTAWVSAADTVTVRAYNCTASTVTPSPGMFKAVVVR